MEGPIADSLGVTHPYYPSGVAIPTFVANTMSPVVLVSIFCAGCGVILAATYLLATSVRPGIALPTVLMTFWWVLCGFIHLFFEGYYAYNHLDIPSKNDLFGQLWKEYSLSDSRYMTRDPFMVCMESVTAFAWGPLSFFIAYATVTEHPWRHPLQLVVSMGQLYGDILYYGIFFYDEFMNGVTYSRPERFYYWAYCMLCNAFWIVIPLFLMKYSAGVMANVMKDAQVGKGSAKKRQ